MFKRIIKLLIDAFDNSNMDLKTNDIIGLTRQRELAAQQISFTKIKEGSYVRSKFERRSRLGRGSISISGGIVVNGPYVCNRDETAWPAVDILASNGQLIKSVSINEIILSEVD